jgi:hypothetical protein
LSHRQACYLFPDIDDAEYVMLDVTSNIFPMRSGEDYRAAVDSALEAGFGVLESRDGYILLQRGVSNQTLEPDFFSFAVRDEGFRPQHEIEAAFGAGLRLMGYDLAQQRNAMVRLTTYWQLDTPVETPIEIRLYPTDARGSLRSNMPWPHQAHKPQSIYWFPPQRWPIGAVIAVDSGTLNLWQVSEVHLAVGVSEAAAASDAVKQSPRIISSPLGPPLAEMGTMVRLVGLCFKNTVLTDCSQQRSFSVPSSAEPVHHVLGDRVALVGYELKDQSVPVGGKVEFSLYWQCLEPMTRNYTVFAHLTAPEPWLIWGQDDHQPWHGAYKTTWWTPGEVVATSHRVEIGEETPPGRYLLRVGMHDTATGDRLPAANPYGTGPVFDQTPLAEVEILSTR